LKDKDLDLAGSGPVSVGTEPLGLRTRVQSQRNASGILKILCKNIEREP